MKHYSAGELDRAARASELQTSEDLKQRVRAQLDGTDAGRMRLAAKLGITSRRLTLLLRSDAALPDSAAAALGYRRTVRFEPIDT